MAAAPDEPTRPRAGSARRVQQPSGSSGRRADGPSFSPPVPAAGNAGGPSPESPLATTAVAYLPAGPLTFGGIGFGLDRLVDTWIFLPLGVLVGMGLSIYVIWLRYGTP